MHVVVVGAGKLASELIDHLPGLLPYPVDRWSDRGRAGGKVVVVHAGSGREMPDVIAYCRERGCTLIELATGSVLETEGVAFPRVLCPNTNVLVLKFMNMLEKSAAGFREYAVSIVESHQSTKTSVPGTAVSMARALGVPDGDVASVRDPREQASRFHIPAEHLDRHAFHRVVIQDDCCEIMMEVRVLGASPYVNGVARIVEAALARELENRAYTALDFVEAGWI